VNDSTKAIENRYRIGNR